jgi:hypothetical protein
MNRLGLRIMEGRESSPLETDISLSEGCREPASFEKQTIFGAWRIANYRSHPFLVAGRSVAFFTFLFFRQ